jgi:hypothetical protein
MFLLGIPLSLSQHLFYVFNCLLFVIAIRPLLRNNPLLLLIIYVTLVFHPISYPCHDMARALREGIYVSLPLLVLSFAIGLLLRKDAPLETLKKWSIWLGLSLAVFWLTREEGVLLLPSLFIIFCTFVVSVLLFSQDKLKRIMLWRFSVILPVVIVIAVMGLNKIKYGVFTTSEQKQRDFVNAYSALVRVKPKPFQRYISVPRETRERIYAVSPAFAELRPFLEGDVGKGWSQWGPYAGSDISTHFFFALRDAVASAGYCDSGGAAAKYYHRLALEVNNACDKGLIECYPRGNPFLPKSAYRIPWRREYLKPLLIAYKEVIFSAARLEYIVVLPHLANSGPDSVLYLYRDITRSKVQPGPNDPLILPYQQKLDSFKFDILTYFLSFYRLYMSILVVLGIISYGWHIISVVLKREIGLHFIIMTVLLLAVLVRIYLLALVEVMLEPGFKHIIVYKSSFFPLLTAFCLMAILTLFLKCDEKYVFPFVSLKSKK